MSTQAVARLQKELRDLNRNPVQGIKVELIDESNCFEWKMWIEGPVGTWYEGGIFKATMTFPEDYPNSPPKMKFISQMWHPNIYSDGIVCISILHTPDPLNPQEREDETWRPILTVESILLSVCSMLTDPNFSSPANVDASVEMRREPEIYKQKVLRLALQSREELPPDFEMPTVRKNIEQSPLLYDPFLDEQEDEQDDEYNFSDSLSNRESDCNSDNDRDSNHSELDQEQINLQQEL
jgi:ubiquitin-protein ligase